jgi:dehydrodolichyl diphosphate syntase complex subunit NUS1
MALAQAIWFALHIVFALYLHAFAAARCISAWWWVGIAGEVDRDAKSARLPGHLAFALNGDDVTARVVGDLVCVCATLGIREVSVYDPEGRAHEAAHAAFLPSSQGGKDNAECTRTLKSCHVTIRHQGSEPVILGAVGSKHRLDLNFLSLDDGRPALVHAAQLPRGRVHHPENAVTSTGDKFDWQHRLRRHLLATHAVCATEPELLIKVGSTLTVGGFPPWLLRVSELQHVADFKCLSAVSLRRSLGLYARTEQRFGR